MRKLIVFISCLLLFLPMVACEDNSQEKYNYERYKQYNQYQWDKYSEENAPCSIKCGNNIECLDACREAEMDEYIEKQQKMYEEQQRMYEEEKLENWRKGEEKAHEEYLEQEAKERLDRINEEFNRYNP